MDTETFEPTTMGGVNAFGISSYTKYPKACLAFVKFVSSYENERWRSEALGAVPARTDLAEEMGGSFRNFGKQSYKRKGLYDAVHSRYAIYLVSAFFYV